MLQTGKNITQAGDQLQKTSVQQIFHTIKNPPHELLTKINQLRMVLSLDQNRYRQLKTALPYFTCGIFHPPFRKSEHFGFTEHFVLDYDHLSEREITPEALRTKLIADERVEMLFTSPSGNGLKLMFRLNERCHDRFRFSMFYKIFVHAFSTKYGIEKVVDNRTSDVTRACFLSADTGAYYNKEAIPVNIGAYIDFSSAEQVNDAKKFLRELEKDKIQEMHGDVEKEIAPDILQQIKQKLKPNIRTAREKIIYIPEELEEIISKIKERMTEYDIETRSVVNINYGKKFTFYLQDMWAEVNVFYGKNGFSVVKTPKRGSNAELADITYNILCELLFK